jgi:hypothetical protein
MRFSVAVLTVALAVAPALAADEKPDIEVKTHAAEISVSIAKELKADPALRADLMTEGRRLVEKARADAETEYKSNRAWFKDHKWSTDRSYSLRSVVAGRYVSILRDDCTYGGGAHPNSKADTILWDRTAKKRISIRPFFKDTADNGPTMTALSNFVRLAVAKEKAERRQDDNKQTPEQLVADDKELQEAVQPKLLKIGPISLAPSTEAGKSSGLTFHFSPYDVDAYAAGPYTIFMPWAALKPFLSPDGAAIFGGERPDGDDQQ